MKVKVKENWKAKSGKKISASLRLSGKTWPRRSGALQRNRECERGGEGEWKFGVRIWDFGFEFSFLATLGLLVTVPPIMETLNWLPPLLNSAFAVPIAAYIS